MYRFCIKFNIFNVRINFCIVNFNEINILGINIYIKLLEVYFVDFRILFLFLFLVVYYMNIFYGNI